MKKHSFKQKELVLKRIEAEAGRKILYETLYLTSRFVSAIIGRSGGNKK